MQAACRQIEPILKAVSTVEVCLSTDENRLSTARHRKAFSRKFRVLEIEKLSWRYSSCFRMCLTPLALRVSSLVVLHPLVGVPAALAGKGLIFGSVGGGAPFGGPWHLRGSLAGVQEVGSLHWWFAFQQGPSVLLLLLGARAASVVAVSLVLRLVGVFAQAKQILVCRVAPPVERCDACLWLLSALCWLVVNSGEVFLEFFSVGSGGGLFRACFYRMLCYLRVESSRLRWWDFACPYSRDVGFVSRALWTLLDGSLVSAMGVWLVVLLWKCQSHLVVSCMWKILVVRVSFPCFPLVARGGGAGRAVGAMFSH
ncbi:hypothetical protein Taro_040467 [Colocasia esculenta]|uniref:Transmembrane protein n=1 Tax=Colocasia esculenta TaxID=4460 RepID=A0A843WT47_COLES|nr:hypothetical protein [Colocasia esculenta]